MPEQSSYLRHLPQVLWSSESDPEPLLGQALCVFEKILTGIADGVPIRSGGAEYPPIKEVIDALPKLFNSWSARPEFLPWLASWVALDLEPTWTEYQKRKLITEIVSIYRLRGLEAGLHAYLDIYVQTPARPRIAIDDGSALLCARFKDDGTATLSTIAFSQVVSFAPAVTGSGTTRTMLIRPSALAVDSTNHYFVVDQGVEEDDSGTEALRFPALWRVSSTGEVPYSSATPLPLPDPVDDGALYRTATAAVVDNFDRCSVVSVGDPTSINSVRSALVRLAPPNYERTVVIAQNTTPRLPAVRPVDMVLDAAQNFAILDRGAHLISEPPSGFPAAPKIVVVREGSAGVTTEQHPLANVAEPTALVMEPGGTFIVADASDQFAEFVHLDAGRSRAGGPRQRLVYDVAVGGSTEGVESARLPDGSGLGERAFVAGLRCWSALAFRGRPEQSKHGGTGDDLPGRPAATTAHHRPDHQRSKIGQPDEDHA